MRRGFLAACEVRALLLFALLAAVAPAAGQAPGQGPFTGNPIVVNLSVETPPQEVPLLGQVVYDILVEDLSVDRVPDGADASQHTILLELSVPNSTEYVGWQAFLGEKYFRSFGGDAFRTTATVSATPTVQSQFFRFVIRATMTSSGLGTSVDEQEIIAKLRPFSVATVDLPGAVPYAGPEESVDIPLVVANEGQYPDAFLITATGPEGWFVAAPPRITLMPQETRTVIIQALAPATRVFTPQETAVISIVVRSESDPGAVYERATVVVLEGFFLPGYWVPLVVLGAVCAVAAGKGALDAGRRHAKEQGRPRAQRATPAQAVLLADMKRRDPPRYQAYMERQRSVFRARMRAFEAVRGRRATLEQALVDRQHQQVRQAKAAERAREREEALKERELERRRAELERERARRGALAAAEQRKEEQRRAREEEMRRRREAPDQRRAEAEQRARARKLRAELAQKQRILAAQERKQRAELERRTRELERRKRLLEKRAGRRAPKAPREGGLFGRKKPPEEGGEPPA